MIIRDLFYNYLYLFSKRNFHIREVFGCYNSTAVQLLEPTPKTKPKVIVTFIEEEAFERTMAENMVMAYTNTMIRYIIDDNELK